jgi:hypothetical protein
LTTARFTANPGADYLFFWAFGLSDSVVTTLIVHEDKRALTVLKIPFRGVTPDGDIDARGRLIALLDQTVKPVPDLIITDQLWRTAIAARQITDVPGIDFLSAENSDLMARSRMYLARNGVS